VVPVIDKGQNIWNNYRKYDLATLTI